ncbi:5'-methylthioadenosine/S-adenosylhomocysteine nucleosidase [Nonomuraea sp. NEAU-A123]|uniref:5'-methylthioadenosine/S-adenosylhomocysteine nucleosidase n=1 Tax=Nonomuraea sp. NEAU-A123 TaxID=2839649 RepID=UPI001BE4D844|nr:5'-methylthioadenosine/S-adenosylhomocysteine nucleosidase [Nonomuraea sp. NEAU-A123]MBT2234712.1 5'-methylthioadenosine/S-adenosylhomocysteine nucleosidase [Nonomuraea sp. NEAU-A123]
MNRHHVVILTALDLEYQAIRELLVEPDVHRHRHGTRFEVGALRDGRCTLALAHVGTGNQSAAVLAERAIAEFSPAALLFVGVAGALHSHINLGDVVVATRVYAYHGGTSEDGGLKSRPRSWETSHAADQVARHIARTGAWTDGGPAPTVHFGAIAAGEVVLNSRTSGHARWINQNYNDAFAVEMEGAGVAQAGHLNGALPVVVIRGISDRADGTKEVTDRALWQQRAVANAAAFAAALAEEIAAEDRDGNWAGTPAKARGAEMGRQPVTYNIARDNAQVGVQVGVVHGDVRNGPDGRPSTDLAAALARFREMLHSAQADGRLDGDDCEAAKAELAVADEAMRSAEPESASKVKVALKKLRGLVSDVAELATELAAIIALTKGTS